MFPATLWLVLCTWIAWQSGLNQGMLPAPYRFWGATGAMMIAGLVGTFGNRKVGNVMAGGFALAAFIYYYQTGKNGPDTLDAISITAPGSAPHPKTKVTGPRNKIGKPYPTGPNGDTSNGINPATGAPYG